MKLSEQVERVLDATGISTQELTFMVAQAAITRFRGYSHRYFQWVFEVKDGVVKKMAVDRTEIIGRGDALVYEDHDKCDGKGCEVCGWSGEQGRYVTDRIAKLIEDDEPAIMSHGKRN